MAYDEIDPRNLLRDPNGPVGGNKGNPITDRVPEYPIISVAYMPRAAKGASFPQIEECVMSPFLPIHLKKVCGEGVGNAYRILQGYAIDAKHQLGLHPLDPQLVSAVLEAVNRTRNLSRGIAS